MRTLALLLVFAASACSGGGERSAEARKLLGEPKAAGVEAIPLPQAAALITDTPTLAPDADSENYRVASAAFEDVVAWYAGVMPEGRAWRDWKWCELFEGETALQRTYGKGEDALIVSVVKDEPPAILVAISRDDPC